MNLSRLSQLCGIASVGLCALGALLYSSSSVAQTELFRQARSFKHPRGEIALRTQYFKPEANFDPKGNTFTKFSKTAAGNSYSVFETDIGARMVFFQNLGLFGAGRISAAESSSLGVNRTNSTMSHFMLGADYLLDGGGVNWIPEISILLPLKNLDFTVDQVAASEGVTVFNLSLKAQSIGKSGYFDSGIGISFRDKERSTLMPFNVGAHFNLSRSWTLGGDLRGYMTVFKENKGDLDREAWACVNNGCSKRFGAVNPSYIEGVGALQIRTSPRFQFRLDAGHSITGASTARGFVISAGFNYQFGVGSQGNVVPHTFEEEKLEDEFVPDVNQEVDHGQFEAPNYEPVRTLPNGTGRTEAPRRKDPLQNELDKTEMQIELRSTKKKK